MLKRHGAYMVAGGAMVALGVVVVVLTHKQQPEALTHVTSSLMLQSTFFEPAMFWSGVEKQLGSQPQGKVAVSLVPHHLLASELISRQFSQLKAQGTKKVIIIGPNHYERGAYSIQYSSQTWQTPLGRVAGFRPFAVEDTTAAILEQEHSISGLMPYVSYYLPDATVFSVILKHKTPEQELEALANNLVEHADAETVVVVSVDFSHYLPPQVAESKDAVSRALLLELNEKPLKNLNNDYMDSPASIAVLIKLCRKFGAPAFTIQDHTNSAYIFHNPNLESTTSYFGGYCLKNTN